MSVIEEFEEKIPRSAKLAFGGAQLSSNLLSTVSMVAITYYYNIILGLAAQWVSIAWVIFLVWNTLNDPLFGYLEDRVKSEKYGRRAPIIRFGAPFYAFAFILCWIPLVNLNDQFALFLYFVFALFAIDTMITIVVAVVYILPAEMALTSKARGHLMTYGGVATTLATFTSLLIPILLFTGQRKKGINFDIILFMTIIGIICGLLMFVSSYYIKENKAAMLEKPLGFIESIKASFRNKAFNIYLVTIFCFNFANMMLGTAVFYYIEFVLQIGGLLAILPICVFFLMIILFFPIWYKVLVKIGLKNAFIASLVMVGVGFISLFFLGLIYITAIIALAIIGAAFSGYYLMAQMIFADIADYDEILTKRRRETTYTGVQSLIQKPAISLAPAVFLWVILAFGFNENATRQTANAQLGIMLAFTIIPGILLFIAGAVMKYYPLGGPKWMKQKEELKKIHEEKEQKYIQQLMEKKKI
jgi:GPH family glycoside/pentoside/hexuronide:cation symporter